MRQVGRFHGGTKDSLIRSLVVHSLMAYWDVNGLNWTPHQALLEKHVMGSVPVKVDIGTVRSVLGDIVRAGALRRIRFGSRRAAYRLNRRFANPLQPGYAREIEDLLIEPLHWADEIGNFWRHGRPNTPYEDAYRVATFPHYFAQHSWVRGWLHALSLGIIPTCPDWRALVTRSVRHAPLDVVETLAGFSNLKWSVYAEVGQAITQSGFWSAWQRWKARPRPSPTRWLGDWPEEALALLHTLCGHEVLDRFSPARRSHRIPAPTRLLAERFVYVNLDKRIRARLLGEFKELAPETRLGCETLQEPVPSGLTSQSSEDLGIKWWVWPRTTRELPRMWSETALAAAIADMTRYRYAWPRELYSPAW